MCTTVSCRRQSRDPGCPGRLARAGGAVEADQAPAAEGRRAIACQRQDAPRESAQGGAGLTRRAPGPRYDGTVSTIAVAGQQVHQVGVLGELTGLGVPEPHPVADLQQPRARPGERCLHLAGSLEAGQVQVRGRPRDRQPVLAGGSAGDEAAACHRRETAAGSAYDGKAVERRRPRLEALVVVEQAGDQQPGAGGDLGDDRVGHGGLDAARAAAVPELQVDHARAGPARSRSDAPRAGRPRPT